MNIGLHVGYIGMANAEQHKEHGVHFLGELGQIV